MTKAEYKIKLAEEIIEERKEVNDKFLSLEVDNIKQLRNLIIQFVIISSATIGFSLPILGNGELIANSVFLIGGMIELLVVVLYGFLYLTQIIQKENNDLKLNHDAFSKFLDEKRNAKIKYMRNIDDKGSFEIYEDAHKRALVELDEKIKPTSKEKDYALDIIFIAFFIGLLLIVLSMVNFSLIDSFLKNLL